ncbi:hypothetical protein DL96DRAFT_1561909 [Flagelloscypha sp. PMI_526]|nr:hypothetical protein DL96DRAFT_1561909 [Flagelloscypha sp. PMI_526]
MSKEDDNHWMKTFVQAACCEAVIGSEEFVPCWRYELKVGSLSWLALPEKMYNVDSRTAAGCNDTHQTTRSAFIVPTFIAECRRGGAVEEEARGERALGSERHDVKSLGVGGSGSGRKGNSIIVGDQWGLEFDEERAGFGD